MNATLFDGYRVHFNKQGPFEHFVGGELKGKGSACPNCSRPLVIYLSLDLKDERIKFPDGHLRRLPLVYCVDCELCCFDFVYRVDADDSLKVLAALRTKDVQDIGITSLIRKKHIKVDLSATPPELERLAAKLNARGDLTKEQVKLFGELINNFAPPEVGGYPKVDCYNQIGGRAFLMQRLEDPMCEHCPKSRMRFLASLYNEKSSGVKIVPEEMQIVYFACPKCAAILVQHSAS